jgi:hypothetical protein
MQDLFQAMFADVEKRLNGKLGLKGGVTWKEKQADKHKSERKTSTGERRWLDEPHIPWRRTRRS